VGLTLCGCASDGGSAETRGSAETHGSTPHDPINATVGALDDVVAAGPPGAMLYRSRPNEMSYGSSGRAATNSNSLPDLYDRWRIASVTKPFVATVVLRLVEQGVLELDAAVERYVPGLLPASMPITLRQLLNHTSGLADYHDFDGLESAADFDARRLDAPSARDRIALAVERSPVAKPGAEYHYTDTNYRVLEVVLETATGEKLGALLDEHIIEPLQLSDTSFPSDETISGPHLHGYMPSDLADEPFADQAHLIDYTEQTVDQTGGAGALISSASDIDTFYRALLGGKLLSAPMLREMQRTVPVDEDSEALGTTGSGLGIESWDLGCGEVWGHGGSTRGYTTLTFASADANAEGEGATLVLVITQDPLPPAAYEPTLRAVNLGWCGK